MASGPGDDEQGLEHARRALYRPGATDADRERYAVLAVERTEPQPGPEVAAQRPRRTRWVVGGTLVVMAALAGATALLPRPEVPTAPDSEETGRAEQVGSLGWQVANTVATGNDLDGATAVEVPPLTPGKAQLLVVRCPAEDRSFQVLLTGGGRNPRLLYGACGSPAFVPLGPATGRPLEVLVTTRGAVPFSVTVLAR